MPKIILERHKCIGCGTCSVICPSSFEMADDGRVSLKDGKGEDDVFEKEVNDVSCNGDAAQSCPVQCIHVKEN